MFGFNSKANTGALPDTTVQAIFHPLKFSVVFLNPLSVYFYFVSSLPLGYVCRNVEERQ
jgi:hypothetical protein